MARKLRVEYAGALYHVIGRGNYRKPIFEDGGGEAFERALGEVCGKCGWLLHAYVIMNNHYHLALETPEANLVEGMRWLQGTFGIRFNAYRGERGHVFQGRYKCLVVEPGRSLLGLVNYIHLNPVRAGLVDLEHLADFPLSSFTKFLERRPHEHLVREQFLSVLEFPDTVAGMRCYAEYLATAEEHDPAARDDLIRRYSRGWSVAGMDFREQIKRAFAADERSDRIAGQDFAELREHRWQRMLDDLLADAGKTTEDVENDRKSAKWKIRIARHLRAHSSATNKWIAENLSMGHPTRVCNLLRG